MSKPARRSSSRSAVERAAETVGLRELRDPRDMRALAHPTRLALLEILGVYGPMTATQAAERVGESPSSCSFHLRTLAKHNFVEETGEGQGRERPWRVVNIGTTIMRDPSNPSAHVAAEALSDLWLDRFIARLRAAREIRNELPPEWSDEHVELESVLWVTPEEQREINQAVLEIAMRYVDRLSDPARRPEGTKPVELLYYAFRTDFGPDPA